VDGRIVIVPAEADIVREGYRRYNAGESYYAIAADWNARGIPTHDTNADEGRHTAWSMTRVRAMLRNAHYAGQSNTSASASTHHVVGADHR
jgi:hypothetical protein